MQGNPNQVFFEIAQQGVVVTGTHVRFGSSVYPLAGITAILHHHVPANRMWGVLALLVGVAVALLGFTIREGGVFIAFGALVALVGIMVIALLHDRWVVRIDTASGRAHDYVTIDANTAGQLALALRNAIDARG